MTATPIAPTTKLERVLLLDILRGFAMLGILFVNLPGFSSSPFLLANNQSPSTLLNLLARGAIDLFCTGKFYSIFSFLFGIGLALQLARSEGENFIHRYCRRMIVLAGFGLLHLLLLWWGDILHIYAILGSLLLFFRNCSLRTLLMAAAICLALPIQLTLLETIAATVADQEIVRSEGSQNIATISSAETRERAEYQRFSAQSIEIYQHGSFREICRQRWQELKFQYSRSIFTIPHIFAMFLLGLAAGRARLFERLNENIPALKKIAALGMLIGFSSSLVFVILQAHTDPLQPDWRVVLIGGSYIIGATILAAGYIAVMALLSINRACKNALMPFAAVGRMALSNYLFQSIIATTICYSYGLARYGRIDTTLSLMLTVTIFAAQLILSSCWLRYFQFGPLEWLWRSLTYRRFQPLRKNKI